MRSLLKGFFSIIALAMLGLVGWDAVRTAGAQGGGFPVNPTFQSVGIFTPATPGSVALNVTGIANNDTVVINGSSTSGQSDGLDIFSGTTSADYSACFRNQAGTVVIFCIRGDGGIVGSNPTGGDEGSGTLNMLNGFYFNGTKIPRTVYANTLTSNTACPLSSNPQSSGFSGCVRNSVGNYTLTFSTAFTTNGPSCTIGNQAAAAAGAGFPTNPPAVELGTTTTTSVTVEIATYTAIGTPTLLDGLPFSIICVGT